MTNQSELMVKCKEDCGNAPKKLLLKDLTIALAKHDIDFCLNCMRDDVVWDMIGKQQVEGIDEYEQALLQMKHRQVQELHIHHIITHGNTASVNGTFYLTDGGSIAFCDVYDFGGFGKKAKIKKITSYVIPIS